MASRHKKAQLSGAAEVVPGPAGTAVMCRSAGITDPDGRVRMRKAHTSPPSEGQEGTGIEVSHELLQAHRPPARHRGPVAQAQAIGEDPSPPV